MGQPAQQILIANETASPLEGDQLNVAEAKINQQYAPAALGRSGSNFRWPNVGNITIFSVLLIGPSHSRSHSQSHSHEISIGPSCGVHSVRGIIHRRPTIHAGSMAAKRLRLDQAQRVAFSDWTAAAGHTHENEAPRIQFGSQYEKRHANMAARDGGPLYLVAMGSSNNHGHHESATRRL